MQAIHPDYFKDLKEMVARIDDEPIQNKEEKVLSDLSQTAGWKVLKEYIEELKTRLSTLLQTAMESGASYEEIGQKTIVTTLTKSYLDQVIERVENARTALETQPD